MDSEPTEELGPDGGIDADLGTDAPCTVECTTEGQTCRDGAIVRCEAGDSTCLVESTDECESGLVCMQSDAGTDCVVATCDNGLLGGDESDVDCEGAVLPVRPDRAAATDRTASALSAIRESSPSRLATMTRRTQTTPTWIVEGHAHLARMARTVSTVQTAQAAAASTPPALRRHAMTANDRAMRQVSTA
jgi:hypothetical protein